MRTRLKALAKEVTRGFGYEVSIDRIQPPAAEEERMHFLHLGKCAGTTVTNVARQVTALPQGVEIVRHSHDVFLRDLPTDARYFFSIRDPISRFVSGFYTRKRKGQPLLYSEWSPHEERAFQEFNHANDLAESLFHDGDKGVKAFSAMKSIRHTAQNQVDWFYCAGNIFDVRPPIWIIRQEHFERDLRDFFTTAGIEHLWPHVRLDKDPVSSHANNYQGIPDLSDKAKANLQRWYEQDFAFYRACEAWLDERA